MVQGEELPARIISTVADTRGVSETALPPLYESIDPDALQALLAHQQQDPDATVAVEFEYAGCTVSLVGPEIVSVEEISPDAPTL